MTCRLAALFSLIFTTKQYKVPLNNLDWSKTGNYIQASTENQELFYFDVKQRKIVAKNDVIEDQVWNRQTCTRGSSVIGAWKNTHFRRGSDFVTSLHVTGNGDHVDGSGELVVTGNLRGTLRLFEYPCYSTSNFYETTIAKSPISHVRFVLDDSQVLVAAENIGCIFRFKVC